MSESIHLHLPGELYQRIRDIGQKSNRPVEDVVISLVETALGKIATPSQFIDQQLWAIVNQRLSPQEHTRLHVLMEKNNREPLSSEEQRELNTLIEEVDRQMLLRSEALFLLQQRGHDIKTYLESGLDDTHPQSPETAGN